MIGLLTEEEQRQVSKSALIDLEAKILVQTGFDFGFPIGPITLGDLVGLELFWKMRQAAGNMALETKVRCRGCAVSLRARWLQSVAGLQEKGRDFFNW